VVLSPRHPRDVVLMRSDHRGQGGARNVAASRAHGEVLAFLDADDVWLPDKLEVQLAALVDGNLDMVFGTFEEFVSPELTGKRADAPPVTLRRGPLPSVFVVRTKAFRRVGNFREDILIGDFIDWHSRALEAGLREAGIDRVVTRRRIHDRNAGIVLRDLRGQYAHVLKERLDRRRAQQ